MVLEPSNEIIKNDLKEISAIIQKGIAKQIDEQPLIVPRKAVRRRVPIQDINRGVFDIPTAAENSHSATVSEKIKKEQKKSEIKGKDNAATEKIKEEQTSHLSKIIAEKNEQTGHLSKIMAEKIEQSTDLPKLIVEKVEHNEKITVSEPVLKVFQKGNLDINTLYEFEREWKSMNGHDEARFDFLLQLNGEKIQRIFKSSFEVGYLNDFLTLIQKFYLPKNHLEEALSLLESIGDLPRIKMVIMLLSKEKKKGKQITFFKNTFSHLSYYRDRRCARYKGRLLISKENFPLVNLFKVI